MVCLLQFLAGLVLDRRYEGPGLIRQLFWAIWYPALFWVITAGASVVALPIVIRHYERVRYGLWKSPDR